jgi:hypothetical protein
LDGAILVRAPDILVAMSRPFGFSDLQGKTVVVTGGGFNADSGI